MVMREGTGQCIYVNIGKQTKLTNSSDNRRYKLSDVCLNSAL